MIQGRNDHVAELPPLTHLYQQMKENVGLYKEEDLQKMNVTEELERDILYRVKHKMLNSILLIGPVRRGKSTVAIYLMDLCNSYIEKVGLNKNIDRYKLMTSDEVEFNRLWMQGGLRQSCVLLDEHSQMSTGSEANSSYERNMLIQNQEMFASFFVHRIMCCPSVNNNFYVNSAEIILEVIGRREDKQTTLVKVFYRDANYSNGALRVPLGYANIFVGDIINNEDFYGKYLKKKNARLELMEKYSVSDIRVLEQSKMILMAYEKLKNLANGLIKMPLELIDSTLKEIMYEEKLIYSLTAKELIYRPIRSLLSLKNEIEKMKLKLTKKISVETRDHIEELIKVCEEKLENSIEIEKRNIRVLEEYRNII
jgi:hypothetical protein